MKKRGPKIKESVKRTKLIAYRVTPKNYIETEYAAAVGGYESINDYVREAIREKNRIVLSGV